MFRNYLWRLGWLVVLLIASTLVVLLGYHNLSVRFASDTRFQIDRQGLLAIHRNIPNSPRLNNRLAESYLRDVAIDEQALKSALYHARMAADRSLWDYRTAHILGSILEISGDLEGAERALRSAVRLSPNYTRANWALGNLLARQSRLEESLPYLTNAASHDPALYPSVFDILWEISDGNENLVTQITANNADAQFKLVDHLLDRSRDESALRLFRQIDPQRRRNSTRTLNFILRQIDGGNYFHARELWSELYPEKISTENLITNGGFEQQTMLDRGRIDELETLFEWRVTPSRYAQIGIDGVSSGDGARSIRVLFIGKDTTVLDKEIRQQIALKPGSRYRLTFAYRTSQFSSPLGPRVAITSDKEIIAQSEAIQSGSVGTRAGNSWIESGFEFSAPIGSGRRYVSIIRQPQFSYDDPTTGVVWFDAFSLIELDTPSN